MILNLTEVGGPTRALQFSKDDITIGRADNCDVPLPRSNISKTHARIVAKDGRFVLVDLRSTNGTFVNGRKISSPAVLRGGEVIGIGDFVITVAPEGSGIAAAPPGPPPPPSQGGAAPPAPRPQTPPRPTKAPSPAQPARAGGQGATPEGQKRGPREKAPRDPAVQRYAALLKSIHDKLIDAMDLRRVDIGKLGDQELWQRTEERARAIIERMDSQGEIPMEFDRRELLKDIMNEALGLGPLEEFLADEEISEIMVNNSDQIYLERGGKLILSPKTFSSDRAVLGVIERIVAPIGRRIDESSPMVDARLKDGSRVNAIIPPLALKGPCITIRKFRKDPLQVEELIKYGTLTKGMAQFLDQCVKSRKNIIISGGTGSGKTTTLNIMSSYIPATERIVTVEDAAELQLRQDHVVALETRPPNVEGKGAVVIRDLVRNTLRMRPDRIVVGECRGGEALDMLQAMNTGHDGSLTTVHANSPRDALARLETMVLMAGMDLPIRAIREQVASAVNMIVQQTRFADGSRRITNITELTGMEVDIITMQDIFAFKQEGFDEEGRVRGRFVSTGFIPKFYDELQRRGIPVNMEIFRES